MVTKLFLRPNSFPLTSVSPTEVFLFPKFCVSKLPIISLLSTSPQAITHKALSYGPSLLKGKIPFPNPQKDEQYSHNSHPQLGSQLLIGDKQNLAEEKEEGTIGSYGDKIIDEDKFTRVFDIAALRVPAKVCFALESRIRGHLLNWPRIRNIARVPGDEVEEELATLLGDTKKGNGDEEGNPDALNRRIYGRAEGDGEELNPVLYRERLAKEFNSRGFVKFRNLAKISRPSKKKRKEGEGEEKMRQGNRKEEFSVVEVVEEEGDDWKGLLGDDFRGRRKWTGSTRLLLLDERYADKEMEDLPQAIKVAFPNTFNS